MVWEQFCRCEFEKNGIDRPVTGLARPECIDFTDMADIRWFDDSRGIAHAIADIAQYGSDVFVIVRTLAGHDTIIFGAVSRCDSGQRTRGYNTHATMNTSIIDSYMLFLQTLNPDARLDIISRLTQTLKSEIKPKENLFAKSFGAWSGSESADEIVKGIKDSRTFNRQIEGL